MRPIAGGIRAVNESIGSTEQRGLAGQKVQPTRRSKLPSSNPTGCCKVEPTRRIPVARTGFTLVELLVASAILTVLLAAVWSMFQMQQRTLEQGQRLSRRARVSLALQAIVQADLQRLVAPARSLELASRTDAVVSSDDADADTENATLSNVQRSILQSFSVGSETDDTSQVEVAFRVAGGLDWLVLDVMRPGHQWTAFNSAGGSAAGMSSGGAAVSSGIGLDMASVESGPGGQIEAWAQIRPTPFERVIYIWLTDEELREFGGWVFGYPELTTSLNGSEGMGADSSGTSSLATQSGAESPSAGSSSMGGFEFGADGASELPRRPRTLLRIRTEWSWPDEEQWAGATWDDAMSTLNEAATELGSELSDAGGDGSSGESSQRVAWLRQLTANTDSGYAAYHVAGGTAVNESEAGESSDAFDPMGSSPESIDGFTRSSQNSKLDNQSQAVIDWFPEITDGQFQYYGDNGWQDSFESSERRSRPMALQLQFQLDPRHWPNSDAAARLETAGQTTSPESAWEELPSIDLPMSENSMAALDGSTLAIRPKFPEMIVFTFESSPDLPSDALFMSEDSMISAEAMIGDESGVDDLSVETRSSEQAKAELRFRERFQDVDVLPFSPFEGLEPSAEPRPNSSSSPVSAGSRGARR